MQVPNSNIRTYTQLNKELFHIFSLYYIIIERQPYGVQDTPHLTTITVCTYCSLREMGTSWVITGGVSRVAGKYNLYLRPGTTLWSTRHPARNDHHSLYLLLSG